MSGSFTICFVAHYAYGAMAGGFAGHVGGVERQTSMMASWLAEKGHRVSLLTWDEGQEDEVEINGVRVIKMCAKNEGIIGGRFFYPRWSSLLRAMRKADAQIYYHNCAEYITGQVALWCKINHRKFIYSIANDTEVDRHLPDMKTFRDKIFFKFGLRLADNVISQSETQQKNLKNAFNVDSVVLPMPCPSPHGNESSQLPDVNSGNLTGPILWLARLAPQKRPDRLLELAKMCPEYKFDLVGPCDSSQYVVDIVREAEKIPNIQVHGAASRHEVDALYRRSFCLCCTSDFEGFPNTFLEAWSHAKPIVSTFDPDRLIVRRELGLVGDSTQSLAEAIHLLKRDKIQYLKLCRNARQLFLEKYELNNAMIGFENFFKAIVFDKNNR